MRLEQRVQSGAMHGPVHVPCDLTQCLFSFNALQATRIYQLVKEQQAEMQEVCLVLKQMCIDRGSHAGSCFAQWKGSVLVRVTCSIHDGVLCRYQ